MFEVEDWIAEEPLGPVLNVDETSHTMVAGLVLQAIDAQTGPGGAKHKII